MSGRGARAKIKSYEDGGGCDGGSCENRPSIGSLNRRTGCTRDKTQPDVQRIRDTAPPVFLHRPVYFVFDPSCSSIRAIRIYHRFDPFSTSFLSLRSYDSLCTSSLFNYYYYTGLIVNIISTCCLCVFYSCVWLFIFLFFFFPRLNSIQKGSMMSHRERFNGVRLFLQLKEVSTSGLSTVVEHLTSSAVRVKVCGYPNDFFFLIAFSCISISYGIFRLHGKKHGIL